MNLTGQQKWLSRLSGLPHKGLGDQGSTGKELGPFDHLACRVNRYLSPAEPIGNKLFYQRMFLVDCDSLKINSPDHIPGWLPQLLEFNSSSASESTFNAPYAGLFLSFENYEASYFSINHFGENFSINTVLRYPLTSMDSELFNSSLIQDTLNGQTKPKLPCEVSILMDGQPNKGGLYKCDVTYSTRRRGLTIDVEVDYGLMDCFQKEDKYGQRDIIYFAYDFITELKSQPNEVIMEVKFDNGETMTGRLDLSSFNFESLTPLFMLFEN